MFTVTRRIEIDAGHRIPDHASKCFNLHGHRYVIEATLQSEQLVGVGEERGMVMDFGFLKAAMMKVIHDEYDHRFILYHKDPEIDQFRALPGLVIIPLVPTAENLAHIWLQGLQAYLPPRVHLQKVEVWETPNCVASFFNPHH